MTKKRIVAKKKKVAKKRKKRAKKTTSSKKNVDPKVEIDEQPPKIIDVNETERQIQLLIERGKKKGFLTYEEMNDSLPDDAISASRLDRLLANLDEMGVSLFDEDDVESHQAAKAHEEGEFETSDDDKDEDEHGDDKDKHLKEDVLLERQLVGEDNSRRIDDPIRMYLTQMGQIPLLTRKSEIALARKIEIARMTFRRKMLQCDYCSRNSLDLFQQVQNGTMSFDRTIKVGTA